MATRGDKSSHARGGRVGVLLPRPFADVYDYRVGDGRVPAPGAFVVVPLARSHATGVVWDAPGGDIDESRLKDVAQVLDAPPLPEVSRRFVDWVSEYTLYPKGAVLKMVMSASEALNPPAKTVAYALPPEAPDIKMTKARERVLAVLAQGPPLAAADLAREAAVGPSVVKGLAQAGALAKMETEAPLPFAEPDWRAPGPALSESQAEAADALRKQVAGDYSVSLLDGVPGSGKTEVYFEAVAKALESGRQVLVLLPEIALGAQWLKRFAARFGVQPASWHSDLTKARRRVTWRAVAEGKARVVVGARSALFLPFPDLGLIIVDEEHDGSYKQDEGVIYSGRDMAVARGWLGGIPVVLASATPSLETLVNADGGRYAPLSLPARHGGSRMPQVEAIDMRADAPAKGRWLSPALLRAIDETLKRGEQSMLFLNRRGFAPLTLCKACGHRLQCPRCTAWLVEHRRIGRLQCHHCGFNIRLPDECPECDKPDSFVACGPGVERIAEEVDALYPGVRWATASSDTLHGPDGAAELVRKIEDRELDLIIGTQILAKGYHFPFLTLVGVVDADLGLAGGDLRAAERTYQLLYQVAGRAGRAERPGRVLLQSWMPDHKVIGALTSGDRERFIVEETAARRASGMPPFGRLAALIVSSRDEDMAADAARELGRTSPRLDGVQVLGPAPAPLAMLRGRHRWRFLVKATRSVPIQPVVRDWLEATEIPAKVKVQVDVDPLNFL